MLESTHQIFSVTLLLSLYFVVRVEVVLVFSFLRLPDFPLLMEVQNYLEKDGYEHIVTTVVCMDLTCSLLRQRSLVYLLR